MFNWLRPRKSEKSGETRRDVIVGLLAMSTAPAVVKASAKTPSRDDPFYIHTPPPEDTVIWSKRDNAWVWISKPMGKADREWERLAFDVTAGISDTIEFVPQKGDRIRMFLVYDSPEGIGMSSIITAATHKSIYAEPRRQNYNIASVMGMDAERKCRLYIASPAPFVVHRVDGMFRVTQAFADRWHRDNPGAGSMADPERPQTFYRNALEERSVTEEISKKIGYAFGGSAETPLENWETQL